MGGMREMYYPYDCTYECRECSLQDECFPPEEYEADDEE